ncbi:MAG: 30S ribosomal protein S8 [Candidatus Sungbacteria bacterium RIFCSPLOWO2_01_FULL_59_16]|uniref:Small ribosomal subunit protein uS8 n=1 Tax=Candidatus Sungbacteria bacterium RIFCSPLOWO2_01_FULL_59_16 TaxID=1802280 RepID=A0A1G2LBH5_9BACT|nr:MAG: 30S ribosomal protein S8 [Candidatus Sungbacteria bacterium RIFCSPLOWO2_01_FULL_59_16]
MTDPISDLLTRIRNGYRARKPLIVLPHSELKEGILRLLEARRYIGGFEKKGRRIRKFLEVKLHYEDSAPALHGIRRISKPSRRIYLGADDIRPVRQGYGFLIVSTSKGLLSGEEARKGRVGGEVIAEVW